MVLYHWARCSSCRRLRGELASRGFRIEERDFFADPLNQRELDAIADAAGGVRALVSTASPAFRANGRPLPEWTDADLLDAMLHEPRLLRRPLLVTGEGRVLFGAGAIAAGLAIGQPA